MLRDATGDQLRFHAHSVVHIVEWDEMMSPLKIVSIGRLGVVVKKSAVLATVNPNTNKVQYLTLDWQGVT
jgi:tRNA splicing endonuclease